MAKRLFWFGVGAASGGLAVVWGLSSVRRASQRLSPDRLPGELADAVVDRGRSFSAELRGALAEGRDAMAERERELREALRHRARRRPTPTTDEGQTAGARSSNGASAGVR